MLLIVDLQVGLHQLVRDWESDVYRKNMMAHAELGKLFNLPVVMTTSAERGFNGPLPKEILDLYPDAPLIKRGGEVKSVPYLIFPSSISYPNWRGNKRLTFSSAWDNADFRAAVEATGKKQVIIGGIVTDVCTAFLALSLRAEGYTVFANVEGSGTTSTLNRDTANLRMDKAGVHLVSMFAIIGDLMRDWRSTPGAAEVLPYLDKYLPGFGMLARGHGAAVQNGTLFPGQDAFL
jgi:nicotinamidase-related amidase